MDRDPRPDEDPEEVPGAAVEHSGPSDENEEIAEPGEPG
jgi:hypothetical protein